MSLFAGHKRELGDDDGGQSANFKKLKSDLGALFGFGNGNTLIQQHNTVVSFRELAILDDKACTNLVDILKSHGYYKVKEMPPEFVNACGNLQDDNFKRTRFHEKEREKEREREGETETGYKRTKDREAALFRKGYHLNGSNANEPRGVALDPARDLHSRFEQYFAEATKAANVILQAIIKGLGGSPEMARNILPSSHEHNSLSTNVSRAFHYFDTPLHTVICPPHLDLGLLTLIPSNFPGLQGESLNEYAGGLIPPGLHRVVSEKPVALNFNFPFSTTFTPLSPLSPLSPAPTSPSSPSPAPVTTPPAGGPPAKKSRSKKAAAKDSTPSTPTISNSNSNSLSPNTLDSPLLPQQDPGRIGRISLPFLLRPRPDAKLDGSIVGLRPGRNSEKSAGQFFEEERMKKGGVAGVGQYP